MQIDCVFPIFSERRARQFAKWCNLARLSVAYWNDLRFQPRLATDTDSHRCVTLLTSNTKEKERAAGWPGWRWLGRAPLHLERLDKCTIRQANGPWRVRCSTTPPPPRIRKQSFTETNKYFLVCITSGYNKNKKSAAPQTLIVFLK